MSDLERRVLACAGWSAAATASAEACTIGEVAAIRRRHGRSPTDGLTALERPIAQLRDDDWARAMSSNSSPFL